MSLEETYFRGFKIGLYLTRFWKENSIFWYPVYIYLLLKDIIDYDDKRCSVSLRHIHFAKENSNCKIIVRITLT